MRKSDVSERTLLKSHGAGFTVCCFFHRTLHSASSHEPSHITSPRVYA